MKFLWYNIFVVSLKGWRKMKKEKNIKNQKEKVKKTKYDKGQIFVKVMAGVLALLMVLAAASTLIYSLMI